MKERFIFGVVVLLLGIVPGFSEIEDVSPDKYIYRHWNTFHGLPQGTVRCIAQDSYGFLWLGTARGLARFDGNRFQLFCGNDGGLKKYGMEIGNRVNAILSLPDKSIWSGTERRGVTVYYYRDRRYRHLNIRSGLPSNTVRSIAPDTYDSVWLGTWGGGLVHVTFAKDRFRLTIITSQDGLSDNRIHKVLRGMGNSVWIATVNGLNLRLGKQFTHFSRKDGLPANDIRSLCLDRDRVLWVGTSEGLARMERYSERSEKPEKWRVRPLPSDLRLPGITVHDIKQDDFGAIWAASSDGLYRIVPGKNGRFEITRIDPSGNFSPATPCLYVFKDRGGIVWGGMLGQGLISIRRSPFQFYTVKDGLSHPHVTAIYRDRDGTTWSGTNGGGVNRLKNGTFTNYTSAHGLWCNRVSTVTRDNRGTLWVGTAEGLNYYRDGQFKRQFKRFNGLHLPKGEKRQTRPFIRVLYTDKSGTLWAGVDNDGSGLFLYRAEPGNRRFVPIPLDAGHGTVNCIKAEGDRVWVGTAAGMLCLDKKTNRWKDFPRKNQLDRYDIRDIYTGKEGYVWIGTVGAGLLCYDMKNIYSYDRRKEFRHATIYRILEDDRGVFWLSSDDGLFAVSRSMFKVTTYWKTRMMRSRFPPVYKQFQESEGLRASVFSGGSQPAGWKDEDGFLWFPGIDGITVVNPEDIQTDEPVLPVVIERTVAGSREYVPGDRLVFPADTTRLEFYCYALNLTGMRNAFFTLNLGEGRSSRWRERITRNKIVIDNLAPGVYSLTVMAGKDREKFSDGDLKFRFVIEHTLSVGDVLIFGFIFVLVVVLMVISRFIARHARQRMPAKIFKEDNRYKTSALKPRKQRSHTEELLKIMEEEKPFLDPDMTVTKLAKRMNVPKEHISQIVNQRFRLNFNQFLNKYRIEEAKKKLLDPKESGFVVLKIAYDVGFNSKSTFNTAFKKFTGINPSQYREMHQEKEGSDER